MRGIIVERNAKFDSFQKEIQTLKLQLSANIESNKLLNTQMDVLKKYFSEKQDKYIEEIIDLEKKKKAHDNILLGYQNPLCLCKAQRKQPALYCGYTLVKKHDTLYVIDTEETLILAEESRLKMKEKQANPLVKEKKVDITPIDYTALNKLSKHFQTLSQDIMYLAMHSNDDLVDIYDGMKKSYVEAYSQCLELEAELSKKKDMVEKYVYNELLKKQARALKPLDIALDYAWFTTRIQELLVYISATCPSSQKDSKKLVAVTPINRLRQVPFEKSRVNNSTNAIGSKPRKNTTNNRIPRPSSSNPKHKNVKVYPRNVNSSLNKKNRVFVCNANVKHVVLNVNSEFLCSTCNECLFDANHDMCVVDYLNDVNARARAKSKSVKTKEWKPTGLPKLKYEKDHLCSACSLGKSKKYSHKPKDENSNQEELYLLHMDLSGPMRVESIHGKKYILVIVDDFSRFTWVKFLRSKDETPEFIIKFLKKVQVALNATVRNIRTDNGTEFVNQSLRSYYEDVGITHQTSVARTPQQNDVVERQNRTLVEAARTMWIFSKAPLFLWAESVATAFYTQN
ncbi:retrovirus-related pol polyprotein from transposon TNT 1-94 [Tanacetum coccineum]|uniref:Retrovirus-related pol polyprotein from transposon TNT 1-94 n=1 Tax=Tanacetum coccineum TaxID=301880 RepID=A0ABQ5FVA7_9ASTR